MIILNLLSYTTEIESLIEKEDNPKDFFKLDAANNLIKITTLKVGEKLDKKFEEELDNFLAISKMDFSRVSALLEVNLKLIFYFLFIISIFCHFPCNQI